MSIAAVVDIPTPNVTALAGPTAARGYPTPSASATGSGPGRAAKGKDPRGMPAREVSSRELVTVGPDHDLSDALQLMAQHQVRRLPVVDDENRLVGVVSQADVALEAKDKSVGARQWVPA
jgi:hypothetical protein